MTIRTAAAALAVDPGEVRVIVEQRSGPPCPGTLDDELAAGDTFERLSLAVYPAFVASDVHLFRIGCGGCAAEWAGEDRAHCAGCHVSFDSIVVFDVDREGGGCLRPWVLGSGPDQERDLAGASLETPCGRLIHDGRGRCDWRTAQLSPSPCRPPWLVDGPAATAALPPVTLELGATH